jgi:hypothetical protein
LCPLNHKVRLTFFLAITLFAGISAAAIKNVAVVESDIDAQSGASAEMTPAEVRLLTAELRREAVKNLPRSQYNVMTSETVMAQGGATLEQCFDENCVITLGSKIGADYIVRGTISKFQTLYTLSVEIYDTEDGNLVASSDPVRSESIRGLLENAAPACGNMYREFAGTQKRNQYKDFSTGQRWGTWGLNWLGGSGSFIVMNDYVGGCILLGSQVTYGYFLGKPVGRETDVLTSLGMAMVVFNIVRSATYHKPKPKSSAANVSNFKPYDGLKLSVVPTETGDFKVLARYDYTF